MYNMYYQNGVLITPNVVADGDKATVTYKGLLFNKGADAVYMDVGYGENWDQRTSIRMEKKPDGFEATLPVTSHQELHLAFKDSANNWDNNSGRNYTFEVQKKR